jgi:transposase
MTEEFSFRFSTPYFPQQNGTAERYMQIVNKAIAIAVHEGTNHVEALRNLESAHNSARHSVTGLAPEKVMFGRKIRRNFPLFRANDGECR